MSHATLPLVRRRFGQTMRPDRWWVQPSVVVVVLSGFLVYATWAAFQNAHYTFGPYLSPFYSPEILGDSPHALFGPKPGGWPTWIPFSPALLILPVPALFRFTCYYYRGAYYKAFWADPPACAVGEPRNTYLGERTFPLVFQNIHRYFLMISVIFLGFLAHDVWKALWFPTTDGGTTFGLGVGTLVLATNVICLSGYTFGCHSMRHVLGGFRDQFSRRPTFRIPYGCASCLNRVHHRWAWVSLIVVALTDAYVRLCSMGVLHDLRLF